MRPSLLDPLFAPVKTLPGVREAIEQRDWKEAGEQILIVAATLERFAAEIDKAAKLF